MRVIARMALAAVAVGLAVPAAADMAMQKKAKELQVAGVGSALPAASTA